MPSWFKNLDDNTLRYFDIDIIKRDDVTYFYKQELITERGAMEKALALCTMHGIPFNKDTVFIFPCDEYDRDDPRYKEVQG